MTSRVAIIGIIIDDNSMAEQVNNILHDYAAYIIGRMGLPYPEKNLNIISIAIDAENNTINTLTGKIGKLPGVSARAVYSIK